MSNQPPTADEQSKAEAELDLRLKDDVYLFLSSIHSSLCSTKHDRKIQVRVESMISILENAGWRTTHD